MVNIGRTGVIQAELIGVKEGLKLAKGLGLQSITVDVDSSLVVLLLRSTI